MGEGARNGIEPEFHRLLEHARRYLEAGWESLDDFYSLEPDETFYVLLNVLVMVAELKGTPRESIETYLRHAVHHRDGVLQMIARNPATHHGGGDG